MLSSEVLLGPEALYLRKFQLDWRFASEDFHGDLQQSFRLIDPVDLPGEVRKWTGDDPHRIAQSKDSSLLDRFIQLRVHTSDFTVLVSGACTRMFVFRDTMLYRFHSRLAAGTRTVK